MNWPERVWIYSPIRTFVSTARNSEMARISETGQPGECAGNRCGLGRGARLLIEK